MSHCMVVGVRKIVLSKTTTAARLDLCDSMDRPDRQTDELRDYHLLLFIGHSVLSSTRHNSSIPSRAQCCWRDNYCFARLVWLLPTVPWKPKAKLLMTVWKIAKRVLSCHIDDRFLILYINIFFSACQQ